MEVLIIFFVWWYRHWLRIALVLSVLTVPLSYSIMEDWESGGRQWAPKDWVTGKPFYVPTFWGEIGNYLLLIWFITLTMVWIARKLKGDDQGETSVDQEEG